MAPNITKQLGCFALGLIMACGTEPLFPFVPLPADIGEDTTTDDVSEVDGSTDVSGDWSPSDTGTDATGDVPPTEDVPSTDAAGTEISCADGVDNDGNGLTDCDDPACASSPACDVEPPECGELIVGCVFAGSPGEPSTELRGTPLSSLECFAEVTTADAEFRWSVIEAPAGSVAPLVPDNGSSTSFFVDLAGRFTLGVSATDVDGCEYEASITIVARSDRAFYYQLVWHTPMDPDETDSGFGAGSDVDIHLLHENGCWEDTTWDCHFRAIVPNWGDPARSDDDPSLDIDDTDGGGPEVIAYDNPEPGVRYRLGAHYYNDHGYGTSFVTAQLYAFGELIYEARDTEMTNGQWWVIGSIEFPSAELVPSGDLYDDSPPCSN
jgi:hypothetical protein